MGVHLGCRKLYLRTNSTGQGTKSDQADPTTSFLVIFFQKLVVLLLIVEKFGDRPLKTEVKLLYNSEEKIMKFNSKPKARRGAFSPELSQCWF